MTTRTKRIGCLLLVVVFLGVIGLFYCALVYVPRRLDLAFESPKLFVSEGAKDRNQAHFLISGFLDRGLSLFVASAVESQATPVLVGPLDWPASSRFVSAVWSSDGSVIACHSSVVTEINRKKQPVGHERFIVSGPELETYSLAYDFRQGKPLMPPGTSADGVGDASVADWQAHNKMIEKLIESRGGPGMKVTRREIDEGSRKLDWAQWQAYKRK